MKVIIYSYTADGSIWRIDSTKGFIDRGMTMEDIELAIINYNKANERVQVCLHDVAECDEKILDWVMSGDGSGLLMDNPVHSCSEEVPAGKYVYVLNKHKGHMYPTIEIMKMFSGGVRIPEFQHEPGSPLPIAWVEAKDLWNLLNLSKRDVASMELSAKSLASFWYKEK